MKCPKCKKNDSHKYGNGYTSFGKRQKHRCKNCGHVFYGEENE